MPLAITAVLLGGATCQRGPRPPPPALPPTPLFNMPTRPVCEGENAAAVDVAAVFEPGLREVSGIAASLLNEDLVWMLADAGNDPAVYAVSSSTGATRLRVDLPVPNVDFEDLALGPCPDLSQPCLFVSDTGDNDGSRATVVVYAFPEPVLDAVAPPDGAVSLEALWVMPMAFPAGERVDVEALAVFPDASALLLIEKTTSPTARVFAYRAPWSSTINGFDTPPRTLEQTGTITVPADGKKRERRVTGAALHWSGTRLLVRFTGGVVEYAAGDPVAFLDPQALGARQVLDSPPGEDQGEAITYSVDGTAVFSIAEALKGESPVLHLSPCAEDP